MTDWCACVRLARLQHAGDTGENWADGYENENVAEQHGGLVAKLFGMLRARFDTAGSTPWPPAEDYGRVEQAAADEDHME